MTFVFPFLARLFLFFPLPLLSLFPVFLFLFLPLRFLLLDLLALGLQATGIMFMTGC